MVRSILGLAVLALVAACGSTVDTGRGAAAAGAGGDGGASTDGDAGGAGGAAGEAGGAPCESDTIPCVGSIQGTPLVLCDGETAPPNCVQPEPDKLPRFWCCK